MKKFTVAAGIIRDKDGKILMLAHNKTGLWTIPLGKVEYGERTRMGLLREMKEEVNIDVIRCAVVDKFTYDFAQGETNTYVYMIDQYVGTIKNKEPHKHAELKWMTLEQIKHLDVTHATKAAINYLQEIEDIKKIATMLESKIH